MFFCDTHSDEQIEAEYLKMAETRRIDGMILVCSKLGGQDAVPLSCDIPRVHIGKTALAAATRCVILILKRALTGCSGICFRSGIERSI